MKLPQSKMFNNPGYVHLKDFIGDIDAYRKSGTWKLPLSFGDSFHFFLLKLIRRFSWFSELIYILNPGTISPAYTILLSYLKKKKLYDIFTERSLRYRGYYSYYFEKTVTINGRSQKITGQGVSGDLATAFSIAAGELIERSISGMLDMSKNNLVASAREMLGVGPIVYPPKFHKFFKNQKSKSRELTHTEDSRMVWVVGSNLITKKKTFIPKQMTSWFSENRNRHNIFIHATTNGTAGYFTKDGAVLRGILEIVQRDGFLVHWLTSTPPQVIIADTLPLEVQKKIKDFLSFGITLYILNITSLDIPSVLVVGINHESEQSQIILGAGSSVTFFEAITSALKEIIISSEVYYFENIDEKKLQEQIIGYNFNQIERQLYWKGKEKIKEFMWFVSGEQVTYDFLLTKNIQSTDEDSDKLQKCLGLLQSKGEDYYPVVYYPQNKIQSELGFYIAQVFIPKAFPLYLVEDYATLDSVRLKEFADSKNNSNFILNKEPHMFS